MISSSTSWGGCRCPRISWHLFANMSRPSLPSVPQVGDNESWCHTHVWFPALWVCPNELPRHARSGSPLRSVASCSHCAHRSAMDQSQLAIALARHISINGKIFFLGKSMSHGSNFTVSLSGLTCIACLLPASCMVMFFRCKVAHQSTFILVEGHSHFAR